MDHERGDKIAQVRELIFRARAALQDGDSFRLRVLLDMLHIEIEMERTSKGRIGSPASRANLMKGGLVLASLIGVATGIDALDLLGIDFIA
ncbi:hypothetical protein [Methylobacterium brachythecii]|uniref:Uncharacterized protein n=1 Tax=Methylobacterium brachythecii TaxID=1176177 RepID=A0A7W6AL86_9HYPH|nr:hypothetical protein [Methylobacterium brachythecii]MBB3905532.1 hypothetical protein [Methylobacterium brachythecii]GLS46257.1 hypothetical protein GCM10007884_42490 [Methylobacterium brachythecii]